MNQEKKRNVNKTGLHFLLFVFVSSFLMVASFFVWGNPDLFQVAKALNVADYNRNPAVPAENRLEITHWNNLVNDFLARDGSGGMDNDLNMNGKAIVNLATPANTELDRAVNVQYVDNLIAAMGGTVSGGLVMTNWGDDDCPATVPTKLYSGYAFSSDYSTIGGITNVLCMSNTDYVLGTTVGGLYTSKIVPLGLPDAVDLPNDIADPVFASEAPRSELKCSVCYKDKGVCYTAWNTNNCAMGFTPAYSGWMMGGQTDGARKLETDAYCINSDYDGSTPNLVDGSFLYGARIISEEDVDSAGYDVDRFVRCAVCCN